MTSRALTRRRLLTGTLAAASVAGLAGCSAGAGSTVPVPVPAAGADPSTPTTFNYTDARGVVVDLPSVPTTVVAQASVAATLWDWGYRVAGVYGDLGDLRGRPNYQLGRIDLSTMAVIGATFGDFDVEKYAAVQPDLLIDMSFDNETLWYVPPAVATRIEPLAPSIGVETIGKNLEQFLATFEELAAGLGADVGSTAVTEAKAEFTRSQERIAAATSDRPQLRVAVLADGSDGTAYVVNPALFPDLQFLVDNGVTLAPYRGDPEVHFQQISYEQVGDHADVDLIFIDARQGPDHLVSQPTMAQLGAVRAGQVHDWFPAAPYSHAGYAGIFAGYADALETARPV